MRHGREMAAAVLLAASAAALSAHAAPVAPAAAAAGAMTPAPPGPDPDTPLPAPLAGEPAAPAAPVPPPPGQPESLPALLARTLAWDPQVRVAARLADITELRRLQARSRLAPVLGVSAVRGSADEQEFGFLVRRETDRAEATLRWNVYNGGNDAAELRAAGRDTAVSAQELRRAREEVAERVADAYADRLRLESLLPHAQERLARVSALTDQVLRQAAAGRVAEADAQQAQATLADAALALDLLQADRDAARDRLAVLVGGEVRPPLPLALPAPLLAPSQAPLNPALLAAAQARVLAARERVRPEVSTLAPRIDLEYRQSLTDRTRPRPTTEVQRAVAVTVRWDFALGGELQARQREGIKRAEATEAEAERVQRAVQAELAALPPRIEQAERALGQLDAQVQRYDALLRAGELQFEAGRRTPAQLAALHDARFATLQRRADQHYRLTSARLRQLSLAGALLPALGLPGE
jgi:outer membrane protein TolC